MIARKSRLIIDLEHSLRAELALQEEYASVLQEEREHITHFQAGKVEELSARRETLSEQMRVAAEHRVELMSMFPAHDGKRLTDLIREHCHPEDRRVLLPLAEKLKTAVLTTKRLGQEFKQLANFSLNLVNGVMSIIWSATQNVTRSYTPQGTVKEAFHAQGSRLAGVLKQA